MPLLEILLTALAMTLGSLLLAALLCSLAWWIALRAHHPRWSAGLLVMMVGSAWLASLGHSEFAKMATVFNVVGAGLLFLISREVSDADAHRDILTDKHKTSGR